MVETKHDTFMGMPARRWDEIDGASVTVIGAAEASPYEPGTPSHSADAPAALRSASKTFARQLLQHDFDLGASLMHEKGAWRGLLDLGDIATDAAKDTENRAAIRDGVAAVLAAGAVPVVLGGDDSVPIPVLAAFEGHGPVTVVQVDAHVDWADVLKGNPNGYGSPMRRASEMPWVTGMVQVGIRGLGSGPAWQHDDARAWGSRIVTSHEIRAEGIDAALRHVPQGSACVLSIDCDGIDPAVLPAVAMPTPGGLTYEDMIALMRGIAAKGRIAGLIMAELVPERDDPHRLSALTAARLVAVGIGLALNGR